jgi:hypothetical protein
VIFRTRQLALGTEFRQCYRYRAGFVRIEINVAAVMPALVAGIHAFAGLQRSEDVGGRNKSGHDVGRGVTRFERDML